MDKAALLGAMIKYMRRLQQRVEVLEQRQTLTQPYDQKDSTAGGSHGQNQHQQPPAPQEIETRVNGRSLLLRFHCRKNKGVLVRVVSEVERLDFAIINISVTPFGDLALGITIIAEMEEGDGVGRTSDVVESLRSAVQRCVAESISDY